MKNKSGDVHSRDPDDWQLLSPNVKTVLREWADCGYKLVIFTNQKGINVSLRNRGEQS